MIGSNELHLKEAINFKPIHVQIDIENISSTNKDQDTFIRLLRLYIFTIQSTSKFFAGLS